MKIHSRIKKKSSECVYSYSDGKQLVTRNGGIYLSTETNLSEGFFMVTEGVDAEEYSLVRGSYKDHDRGLPELREVFRYSVNSDFLKQMKRASVFAGSYCYPTKMVYIDHTRQCIMATNYVALIHIPYSLQKMDIISYISIDVLNLIKKIKVANKSFSDQQINVVYYRDDKEGEHICCLDFGIFKIYERNYDQKILKYDYIINKEYTRHFTINKSKLLSEARGAIRLLNGKKGNSYIFYNIDANKFYIGDGEPGISTEVNINFTPTTNTEGASSESIYLMHGLRHETSAPFLDAEYLVRICKSFGGKELLVSYNGEGQPFRFKVIQ